MIYTSQYIQINQFGKLFIFKRSKFVGDQRLRFLAVEHQ